MLCREPIHEILRYDCDGTGCSTTAVTDIVVTDMSTSRVEQ
jgi:hypothetical protein